ncbi:MAG: DUF885 domain-containing protein, partial [Xanthomonadales bacterium]|nr:DUF885 domain-containing protein [Xanthomonadales bacterium]
MNTTKLLKLLSLLIWIPLLSACGPNTGTSESEPVAPVTVTNPDQEDQRLAAFFSEIFERDVSQSPEFQAYLEIKTEDYGRWDDYSDQYAQEINRQTAADLERLHTEFDYDALSDSAKLSYRIFEYNQQRDLRNFEWRFHDYAISPMNDIASDLPTFLQNIHKIETRKDAEDYISRLAGIQTVMAQVIEQLQLGESIGVIPPMMVYPKVLPGAQNVLQGAPFDETAEDGILLTDFRSKLDSLELDTEEKDILLNDAANALSGPFRNGYQSLIAELTRLQAIANNDHGVWSLPDGEAFYANRIQNWTTVAGTPEELHQLGLSEVARIRSEMQQI